MTVSKQRVNVPEVLAGLSKMFAVPLPASVAGALKRLLLKSKTAAYGALKTTPNSGAKPATPGAGCLAGPTNSYCRPLTLHSAHSIRDHCLLCGKKGPWIRVIGPF